ncbi:cobalt transporter subunit CbtB [Oleiphilus messinensis]|uniref:Cobalt transporter subunit CbtB n=1 Tax=Oleiphilus messinensis TaxID=141451 RepID=A0A1Y0IAL5_9GAMM|nr:CbtB domain-containing protein [Oleiphilus messinensis]ARU56796.1 cobalt transporter subunit CbtB [Oleiphilus messinensis]
MSQIQQSARSSVVADTSEFSNASQTISSRTTQILAAGLLGLAIVFAVGLSPMDVVHNAAHDTRHAIAFPCH